MGRRMDDGKKHRRWGDPTKPLPMGPSARRLTRAEVAELYPGAVISPLYGKHRADELSAVIATGSPTEKPATTLGHRRHRDTNLRQIDTRRAV
jgi:hypothetical protein